MRHVLVLQTVQADAPFTAGRDVWLTPRWHGEAVAAVCTPCERVAHLPEAGHSVLLSPLPPADVLDSTTAWLLADPPGFDRSVLPQVDASTVAFFAKHLQPLKPATASQRP